MWADFLAWLATLPQGSATFMGTLAGSSLGLFAVLIGALFNAHLNRRRDDRLRQADKQSVIAALRAELEILRKALENNATRAIDKPPEEAGGFLAPDLAHLIQVMPEMLPKIGLLEPKTIQPVIRAYSLVQQYCEKLIMLGGRLQDNMPSHRRIVYLKADSNEYFAKMSQSMTEPIAEAIAALDACKK